MPCIVRDKATDSFRVNLVSDSPERRSVQSMAHNTAALCFVVDPFVILVSVWVGVPGNDTKLRLSYGPRRNSTLRTSSYHGRVSLNGPPPDCSVSDGPRAARPGQVSRGCRHEDCLHVKRGSVCKAAELCNCWQRVQYRQLPPWHGFVDHQLLSWLVSPEHTPCQLGRCHLRSPPGGDVLGFFKGRGDGRYPFWRSRQWPSRHKEGYYCW